MSFSTIIFDLDGVVIDSEGLWKKGTTEFLARRGVKADIDKDKYKWISKSPIEIMEIMKHIYKFEGDPMKLHDERNAIIDELYRTSIDYMPGFEKFFEKVTKLDIKTCIATSSFARHIEIVKERLKLGDKFGNRIYSIADVNNIGKPNPDIFLYAAEQVKSSNKECVVIEDSPNGVQASRNAGMYCIAYIGKHNANHRSKLKEAEIVVDDFEDIDLQSFM